jgi:hypothetical protein
VFLSHVICSLFTWIHVRDCCVFLENCLLYHYCISVFLLFFMSYYFLIGLELYLLQVWVVRSLSLCITSYVKYFCHYFYLKIFTYQSTCNKGIN